ncbi:MAG: FIST N-terminal domain-containing protein [Bacteroidia bacterium]|nr:FIST N-terminal domain-containing protein [Bacteroidia bacterium]
MKIQQFLWEPATGWNPALPVHDTDTQLVLFFGGKNALASGVIYETLDQCFPESEHVGCTTSGEIYEEEVFDESVVVSAISFEKTPIKVESVQFSATKDSFSAGNILGEKLISDGLKAVFVLSDGHQVNGSELVQGLTDALGSEVVITGGLAGDGARFEETLVSHNHKPEPGRIVAIGFYGDAIQVGHGSVGGWDTFGPERTITRSKKNVLYELDGKSALELYKTYLGSEAEKLPGSALQFPLAIRKNGQSGSGTVRTILSINEQDGAMVFAGDMPEGHVAQLMMANFDRLVDGAAEAAKYASMESLSKTEGDKLAILVSCVGRKIVLGQRTADEVEAVGEVLEDNLGKISRIGFYSYGEISPHVEVGSCELHNQTMTITYFSEN